MNSSADPLAEFRTLPDDVRRLTAAVRAQDRRGKWNRRLIWLLSVIVAALLVLGLFVWRSAAYAVCNTDRSKALTGPSTLRINLFFQAYTEAAGQIDHKLTDAEKAALIDGLLKERETTFSVLPDREKLEKSTDFQLLAYRDLVAALHANEVYNDALADHPVCSYWGI